MQSSNNLSLQQKLNILLKSTINTTEIKFGELKIIEPSDSIKYPYLVLVPNNKNTSILIWGQNAYDETLPPMEQAQQVLSECIRKDLINYCVSKSIVLVIPILPVVEKEFLTLDSQMFLRDTIFHNAETAEEEYYLRPDIEVLKIILQVCKSLENIGIKVMDKVSIGGISKRGNLANRFSVLYPQLIQAAVIMSAGDFTYPTDKINDFELEYPFGTFDIDKLINKKFDFEAFKTIPHLVYMGTQDNIPDPLSHDASGRGGWAKDLRNLLGHNRNDLTYHYVDYMKALGMDITFIERKDLGHSPDAEVMSSVFAFLGKNSMLGF